MTGPLYPYVMGPVHVVLGREARSVTIWDGRRYMLRDAGTADCVVQVINPSTGEVVAQSFEWEYAAMAAVNLKGQTLA